MGRKRMKSYHKLIRQYETNFSFRPPFQCLLDSSILQICAQQRIPIVERLRKIFGDVKPMISQCCMRHLYNASPKNEALIAEAKTYERRRCGHHELEKPLTSHECISQCVDPKGNNTNKFRYVVATQDPELRQHLRRVPGVPLIYINRSVVILEPMANATLELREQEEKAKFKAGLKGRRSANAGQKRKRDDEAEGTEGQDTEYIADQSTGDSGSQKKKRSKGPKGPNPLSVKKSKKEPPPASHGSKPAVSNSVDSGDATRAPILQDGEAERRKRKRKHKPKGDGGAVTRKEEETAVS